MDASKPKPPIEPDQFVRAVQPVIAANDPQCLLAFLKSRWTGPQIISMLKCDHEDARKVAALCLSLVGTNCCVGEISKCLRDPDPMVNHLAEHALWNIWFRAGTPEANHQIARGAQALGRKDFHHAISHFNRAIQLVPDFAEAYNQRALATHLLEEYEESLKDSKQAVKLMPCHFGAWAGMGHNYAHLGDVRRAIDAYEKALEINPHMQAVREGIAELRARDEV